jgi:hypothetical protein
MATDVICCAWCSTWAYPWVLWSHCQVERLFYFCDNACLMAWLSELPAEGTPLAGELL